MDTADHPLSHLFGEIVRGVFPPFDFATDVVPRAPGALAAVLAFTGHHVVAADVEPEWVERWCPPGTLTAALGPRFLSALADRLEVEPGVLDVVLCAPGRSGAPEIELQACAGPAGHPRLERAMRFRTDIRVYETPDGEGLLVIGRGLAGRWEAGFEVDPGHRNRGLGTALARAALHLIAPGEGMFMQVAAGNVASVRAVLRAGYLPIGAEVLFPEVGAGAD